MWIKDSLLISLFVVATAAAHVGQEAGMKRHAHIAARAHDGYAHILRRAGSANPRKSCKASGNATTTSFTSHSSSSKTSSSTSKAKATSKVTSSGSGSSDSGSSNAGNGKVISTPGSFTPNGIKAGIAGGDAYSYVEDYIGSWYDWTPNPSKPGKPIAIPMLWGGGSSGDPNDSPRVSQFKKISTPQYVLGYEEPDCAAGGGSAGMSVSSGVTLWNELIAPLGRNGARLGSPSMCKQAAESGWLQPFQNQISRDWDFTAIHINKVDRAGVEADIAHYWNTYGKPIWVTEFACVNDKNGFVPCTDQGEIDDYINMIVPLFESDSRVHAYHYSNGEGLGSVWPMTKNGKLSASGQTYLNAIKRYA